MKCNMKTILKITGASHVKVLESLGNYVKNTGVFPKGVWNKDDIQAVENMACN